MSYIMFWLAKFITSVIVGIFIIGVILVILCFLHFKNIIKQLKCNHNKYHETMACDAICNNCGKNLGFIGNISTIRKPTK